jgi:3-deoxy-7-phosphoheptulonate synthase
LTHVVRAADELIGGPRAVVIAGPCAVESLEQTLAVAHAVQRLGIRLLRGGAFKPRTNPHSFQGLGVAGLEILSEVKRRTGLGIVTEVLDPRLVDTVAQHADVLQVGSRSMQNFPLLAEVGRAGLPVLLKRGWSATIEEWLCAAEYVAREGNRDVILCERGIRASNHWGYARSVLDLNVLEPLRRATPLPVIVDPSHATGHWTLVAALSRAALAAGAQGLLIEAVESESSRAQLRSDADQGVPPTVLADILAATRA